MKKNPDDDELCSEQWESIGAMDYRRNRGKIIDTGVQIMEYDDGVSYHGKCFTIDGRLTGIGSFNWDMRSAYLDTD